MFFLLGCKEEGSFSLESTDFFELFKVILEKVEENYVENIDTPSLACKAFRAFLSSLDPFSDYIPPQEWERHQSLQEGEFLGIGIEIESHFSQAVIQTLIPGSPAETSGLLPGDIILSVQGEKIREPRDVAQIIARHPKSKIKITISRTGKEKLFILNPVTLISYNPVLYNWKNSSILYLKVHTFNAKVSQALKNLTEEIKEKNIKGVIIDLRNNNGGLLEEAVEFTRYFIPSGKIVSIYSRNPENNEDYEGIGKDWFYGVPTVVLINRYSASASEIVAGALKDHKRALLIGEKTYGKGSVQTLIKIPGWGGIRLTTGYFQTPLGAIINKKGVEPHLFVKNSNPKKDFPLEKALQWLRESPLKKGS